MHIQAVVGVALAALAAIASAQEDRKAEVASLLVSLKSEKAVERSAAARTLGEIGPGAEEAVGGLQAALRDAEHEVRQNAAQALGYVGPAAKPATADLVRALKDSDWRVRRAAADSLGRIGSREAEPALKAARKDSQKAVAEAANRSLKRLKDAAKARKK